jgi:tetratricopeptide (TPR) repeat protein
VFLMGASKTNIFYVNNMRSVDVKSKRRDSVASVYITEPKEYTEAMSLFEDRKYSEAHTKFGEVMERYKKFQPIKDNHFTLSGFYQLECLRKQLKTDELVKAVADYRTENLIRPDLLKQVEVYKFWEALNSKAWDRLDRLAGEWKNKRVPISQRAQIAYCQATALEALGRKTDALNMYAHAMTADFSKSEEIVRESAHGALRVYQSMPEVKTAMKLWKTEDEDIYSPGHRLLAEANALTRLYSKAGMGAGVALPAKYNEFLKFTADDAPGLKK